MSKKSNRFVPGISFANETLESRVVMSTYGVAQTGSQIVEQAVRGAATQTSVAVTAGTLGQPITYSVTVRTPASAGPAVGTVNLVSHGSLIQTVTLTPAPSPTGKYDYSTATYTMTPQPGGSADFFGRQTVTAQFVPGGAFARSSVNKAFTVTQPAYTSLANGVKIATIVPGTGPAIQSGQTANVLYTGYLAKGGKIFDDSIDDGGAPFSFPVGAGEVIPGFDAGAVGMQVGESRIIEIPASQGYGRSGSGPIPPNATLIFVLTLESIG